MVAEITQIKNTTIHTNVHCVVNEQIVSNIVHLSNYECSQSINLHGPCEPTLKPIPYTCTLKSHNNKKFLIIEFKLLSYALTTINECQIDQSLSHIVGIGLDDLDV